MMMAFEFQRILEKESLAVEVKVSGKLSHVRMCKGLPKEKYLGDE